MSKLNFPNSKNLKSKAQRLIPGGAHTYSRGPDQFPQFYPNFISKGLGSYVWDIDDNEFLDWGMGLRSVCLGHCYKPVLDEVRIQLEKGVNFTLPTDIEVELAEKIVNLVPSAEMVKFAKNGSDVTSAAIRLARAYTGSDIVLRCKDNPFFSVDDWFIGDTLVDSGIPITTKELTKSFPYNDASALEDLLIKYKNKVACIILEPVATVEPKDNFLKNVRMLADKYNVVLIFDEIISGFRWHQSGAQYKYDVKPDLTTFGKAMANGFSLSALVGKRDIMKRGGLDHKFPRVFLLSSTNGSETHSLVASKKTIEILEDGKIIQNNWNKGKQLKDCFNDICNELGIQNFAKMTGLDISPFYLFYNKQGEVSLEIRTLFLQEMIKCGIIIPYISISASHSQSEIDRTNEAFKKSLIVVKDAISSNSIKKLIKGPIVKPVFRKYN